MDVKAIPALIVGVMVAVVMVGAVLPVFADTTQAYDTFTNEGYYKISSIKSDSEDTVTLVWDHSNPKQITVNGDTVDLSALPVNMSFSLAFCNGGSVRFYNQNNSLIAIQFYYGEQGYIGANTTNGYDATITIGNGELTFTNTADPAVTDTITYDVAYYVDNAGTSVMKNSNTPVYVLTDSTVIVGCGISTVSSALLGLYFVGTVEDGYDIDEFLARGTDTTIDNVQTVYTEINSYNDLIKLDKITMDATYNDEVTEITYSYFVVPVEVTAERAVHPDGPLTVLINVLPLMAVAGLLLAGVAWFVWKKG